MKKPILMVVLAVALASASVAARPTSVDSVRGSVLGVESGSAYVYVGRGELSVGQELQVYRIDRRSPKHRGGPRSGRVDRAVLRVSEVLEKHLVRTEVVSGRVATHDRVAALPAKRSSS